MDAKWITNNDFYDLRPIDVFHKEAQNAEKIYDKNLLNSHILFRKKFSAESGNKTIIKISADDYYRLYINGSFICSGPAPGYPWHYYYNEIDITKYIRSGENTLAVHTYYQGLINRVWVSGDRRHGMICSITSGTKTILNSDESFKCHYHTGYSGSEICVKGHDTLFCEEYNSAAAQIGFESPDFDDSAWAYSVERKYTDYKLIKQDTSVLEYHDISPKAVSCSDDGIFIDAGFEISGYLDLYAEGNVNDEVLIRYGEELNEDGTVRYETRCNCRYEDRWILSGKKDRFMPFDYKGFRYVHILCNPGTVDIESIKIKARHYPYREKASCPVNDAEIRKIWRLCADTVKYGTQENFIDCPTREKGQYLGDVCISAVAQAILTGSCKMLKKSITDFAQSSKICPGLMAVSTSSFMQEIADYSLLFPMTLLWYYRLSGDASLLNELYPVVTGLAGYFKKYERSDGLIANVYDKWNLVDWPENLRDGYDFPLTRPVGDGTHNVINAFYIGMLKCINEINSILSKSKSDVSSYEKAYIKEFLNSGTELFTDSPSTTHSSLHSNVLPLFFNIPMSAGTKSKIIKLIGQKGITHSGSYFSFFVLQALKNHGENQLVLKLVRDKNAWLNMLSQGATTTFEAWGKEQKKNCSLFHPWSCCPILILFDM